MLLVIRYVQFIYCNNDLYFSNSIFDRSITEEVRYLEWHFSGSESIP